MSYSDTYTEVDDTTATAGYSVSLYQMSTYSLVGPCKFGSDCKRKYCHYSHPTIIFCNFGSKCRNYHCRYSHLLTHVTRERILKEAYHRCMPCRVADFDGNVKLSGRMMQTIQKNGEITYSLVIPTRTQTDGDSSVAD
jgi:hypothetical protein